VSLSIQDADALKIGVPAPFRQIVGVAYAVAVNGAFVANVAARHEGKLPYEFSLAAGFSAR
jgi:hypothetical protein